MSTPLYDAVSQINPVVPNPEIPGASGPYQAIWGVLSALITSKDAQAIKVTQALAQQLDGLEDGAFDRSRLDRLVAQLDSITTPDQPVLPAHPNPGGLSYTPAVLPTVNARTVALPMTPANRQIMDFGQAPDLDNQGEEFTLEGLRRLYGEELASVLTRAKDGFEEFVRRFLPASQATDEALSWLSDAIHARNTGVPIHVEEKLFERNRTRIDKETTRLIDAATTSWAHKGHSLPPGALVGQVAQLRRDQLEQMATASREVAIYVNDKHIENARFAVGQLMDIRSAALNQAMAYMQALIGSPQNAGPWLTAMLENQQKTAALRAEVFKTRAGVASDIFRAQTDADLTAFKTLADAEVQSVRADNDSQFENLRTALEQERLRSTVELDVYKTRTGVDIDLFKSTQDAMLRFYEVAARVSGIKADSIGRTAETALKIEELEFGRGTQMARLKVDAAMELLKTVATQTSAALNNLQMSASSSVSTSISMGDDE